MKTASKMSVLQTQMALASAALGASRVSVPSSGGGGGGASESYVDAGDAATLSSAKGYTDSEIAGLGVVYQPLDGDLTDIAALVTTPFGRSLLELTAAVNGWKLKGVQFFTSNGTYTPTSGTTNFLAFGVGSAGGGGGVGSTAAPANTRIGGGRGGAGELRMGVFDVSVGSYDITVGATGTGGAAGNNDGVAGGNTIINDGTTDIFICVGGGAGGGSPGNSNGSAGAVGTGGTGGIELAALIVSGGSFPSFSSTAYGQYNVLFGSPVSPVANSTSDSSGALVLSSGATGSGGLGRGSAGGGGWHWNGSTSTFAGGSGSRGLVLIVEFGF